MEPDKSAESVVGNPGKDETDKKVNHKNDSEKSIEATQNAQQKQSSKDDDDDVPGDFFDDFLKEDFMAGLDIVDEDEGEEKNEAGDDSLKNTRKKKKRAVDQKKERKHANNVDLRDVLKGRRKDEDLRSVLKGKEDSRKSSKSKNINADEFDIRRDPKKTRRDIERDKARCEKDKEKKIISEKLRLVETGLVPPGMEMETDLEEIKQKENKEMKESKDSKNSESRSSKSKRTSSSRKRSSSPKKRRSPVRRSPRRSPRKPSRSPGRRALSPLAMRRSPLRRSPIRRSPIRRRSRDRSRRRDTSLRRSLERNRRSRSRDRYKYSPRRKRSHSRSRTPKRRREFDKKKSFLQEIAEKLNETRPVQYQPMMQPLPNEIYHVAAHPQNLGPNSLPGPVPAPVPPPQFQQYDQSFFIGTPQSQISPNLPLNVQVNMPNVLVSPLPQVNKLPMFQQQHQRPPSQIVAIDPEKTKEEVSKLFQDKKITLTEFLSITAKPEVYSASPAHMKAKIQVISRCQEAIKYLGIREQKLSGPLIVQKSSKTQPAVSEKFMSPLLRSPQIKLPFTEIPKNDQNRSDFTSYVNSLLTSLGMLENEVIVIDDSEPAHREKQTTLTKTTPPPAPKIFPQSKRHISQNDHQSVDKSFNKLSKYAQTDEPRCIDCDKRRKITYRNAGTQCGNDGISFSVGTQVSEHEFTPQLPKSQSLASLTPAQLLARSGVSKSNRSKEDDDFDLLFPTKKPVRPPGYAYGAESYGGNRFSPPNFVPPPPSVRSFDLPGGGGGGVGGAGGFGARDRDVRTDGNRYNAFNNYY